MTCSIYISTVRYILVTLLKITSINIKTLKTLFGNFSEDINR